MKKKQKNLKKLINSMYKGCIANRLPFSYFGKQEIISIEKQAFLHTFTKKLS
jgi:hypothetical protein